MKKIESKKFQNRQTICRSQLKHYYCLYHLIFFNEIVKESFFQEMILKRKKKIQELFMSFSKSYHTSNLVLCTWVGEGVGGDLKRNNTAKLN